MPSTGKIAVSDIFSKRLESLRKGVKKAEFAAFLGFTPQNYQRYSRGRVPDPDILLQISSRTGKSVDWLLGREVEAVHEALQAADEGGGDAALEKCLSEIRSNLSALRTLPAQEVRDAIHAAASRIAKEYEEYCDKHYKPVKQKLLAHGRSAMTNSDHDGPA